MNAQRQILKFFIHYVFHCSERFFLICNQYCEYLDFCHFTYSTVFVQAQSVAESEKTDSDESSNNSFDENINNMGSRSSALDLRHQLQQLHQIQTLQQLSQLQQLQQGGRIALSRLGNSGPVIHKPVWRHEKPVKPEMPTILPVRRGEAQPSTVELRQNFVILSKSEIKEEEVEEQMEQDPLRIRDPVHEPEQTLILNQNRGQEQTRNVQANVTIHIIQYGHPPSMFPHR